MILSSGEKQLPNYLTDLHKQFVKVRNVIYPRMFSVHCDKHRAVKTLKDIMRQTSVYKQCLCRPRSSFVVVTQFLQVLHSYLRAIVSATKSFILRSWYERCRVRRTFVVGSSTGKQVTFSRASSLDVAWLFMCVMTVLHD